MNPSIMLSEVTAVAANEAISRVRLGELTSLGQVEEFLYSSVSRFFDKYGGEIGAKFMTLAEPAAKKALTVIQPAVEEALKKYVPTFAGIVGGMIGLSMIGGILISRRVYRMERGGRRR